MSNVDPDYHDLQPRLGQHSHLDAGVQQACPGGVRGRDGRSTLVMACRMVMIESCTFLRILFTWKNQGKTSLDKFGAGQLLTKSRLNMCRQF